jgi:hypothetical protein
VVGLDKDWLVAGDDHHPLRPVLGVLVPCRVGCLIICSRNMKEARKLLH